MISHLFFLLSLPFVYSTFIQPQTLKLSKQNKNAPENTSIAPFLPLSQIFTTLPTQTQIDQILEQADPLILSKLFKTISNKKNSLPCQLQNYVQEISTKITNQIIKRVQQSKPHEEFHKKIDFQLEYLMNIRSIIQTEMNKVTDEVLQNRKFILKGSQQLNSLNKQIKNHQKDHEITTIQIMQLTKSIQLLYDQIQSNKDDLLTQKIGLVAINAQIAEIEKQLAKAQQQKFIKQQSINLTQGKISKDLQTKQNYEISIVESQEKIKKLAEIIDNLKIRTFVKEMDLQKVRQKSHQIQSKELIKIKQLETIDFQIKQKKSLKQSDSYNIESESSTIKLLELILQKLRVEALDIKDICIDNKNRLEVDSTPSNIYVLNNDQFVTYMTAKYGLQFKKQFQEMASQNMISGKYVRLFRLSLGKINRKEIPPEKCYIGKQVILGSVTRIEGSLIQVLSQGQTYSIKMDDCCQIESIKQEIRVGERVFARLNEEISNEYFIRASNIFVN